MLSGPSDILFNFHRDFYFPYNSKKTKKQKNPNTYYLNPCFTIYKNIKVILIPCYDTIKMDERVWSHHKTHKPLELQHLYKIIHLKQQSKTT